MISTLSPIHATTTGTSVVASPPSCDRPMTPLSVREGLWSYRNERVALLAKLGDQQIDIAQTTLGSLRVVYITEAGLARRALTEHNDAFIKGPAVSRYLTVLVGNGLLTSLDDDHRRQRKVLAPKFQPRQVAAFSQTILEHAETMLTRWRRGAPADLDPELNALTVAIAARTMFGADVSRAEIDVFREGLEFANHWTIGQATTPLPVPLWVPTPRNRTMQEVKRTMESMVDRMIAQRRAEGGASSGRADVLSALMNAVDEHGVGMSDELIREQVITFLLAGHETTGISLSWMFRLLAENPEVVERVAAEADAVLGPLAPGHVGVTRPHADIDARQLTYTRAVVQEVMRLRPPSYMIGRQARREVEIDGYRIREGSYLVVNTLGMHRRGDYFDDPLAFRSERFLEASTWPRGGYIPFGAGRRVCIGAHFSTLELTLVTALSCRALRLPRGTKHHLDERTASARYGFDASPLITLQPTDTLDLRPMWRTR